MSGLRKLLKRKDNKAKHASSTEDLNASSGREMAAGAAGYFVAKEKDLPKLHKAVWNKDVAKLKQLAKKGDINQLDKDNRTAIHFAAAMGNSEMCRFLLANKAKTNLCDNQGRTPIMKAVECQSRECTEVLLENRAEANVVDMMNSTPLHLASANGDIDIAVLLIEKEAKVNAQDKEGFTPLHVASSLGNQDFVGFLVNEGANIDAIDAHGRTPLMTSASEGHIGIVKFLLQNNANTEIKDSQGWKAGDHAIIHGHHSCSNIIDEHEDKLEAQQQRTAAVKPGHKTNGNVSNVLGSGTDDLEFTFGGPAADAEKGTKETAVSAHKPARLQQDQPTATREADPVTPQSCGENASGREEDSVSHHSVGGTSWDSSGAEDIFEVKKKPAKPSLLAALKPVNRSESTKSNKSSSRIPVRTESIKSTGGPAADSKKATVEPQSSRIPVLSSKTKESPTPVRELVPHDDRPTGGSISNQSTPSEPGTPNKTASKGTPIHSTVGIPSSGTPTHSTPGTPSKLSTETIPGDRSPSGSLDGRPRSLPWESIGMPSDEESELSSSDSSAVLAALAGGTKTSTFKEPGFGSKGGYLKEPGRGTGDKESDLSVSLGPSGDEMDTPSGVPLDDKPLTTESPKTPGIGPLTSTLITSGSAKDTEKGSHVIPKLELGSPVSSVSEPDVSFGSSDNGKKKAAKVKQTAESGLSDESDWDSSDGDILPSDGPDTTRGSSLFGSSKPVTPVTPSFMDKRSTEDNKKPGLMVGGTVTKSTMDESDSEDTETESEWEKERAQRKKVMSKRDDKTKDEDGEGAQPKDIDRFLVWEKEQQAREEALAMEVQKELEMEMEMERLEKEAENKKIQQEKEDERRREEESQRLEHEELERRVRQERERQEREQEDLHRREEALQIQREEQEKRRKSEEEKFQREQEERQRVEEALRKLEREKEEERLRLEREKDIELERQMKLKEEEMMALKQERDEERRRREEEERRIQREKEEELHRLERENEEALERQMREKEEEETLERERRLREDREAEEARRRREEAAYNEQTERVRQEELREKQRRIKEEEDNLLEAYRRKQEELLEKERRFDDEMARRERELEEKLIRQEQERKWVEHDQVGYEQEQQMYTEETGELEILKKSHEENIAREKVALEESITRRREEEREAVEAARQLEESQGQLRQRQEEHEVRRQHGEACRKEEEDLRQTEEALRWERAKQEIKDGELRVQREIAEQSALQTRIEMEKRQLQDLETRKEILDKQVGAKLTELGNRQRRDELEQKSRQLMFEREQLNASFEAAKHRTALLEQAPETMAGYNDNEMSDSEEARIKSISDSKGRDQGPSKVLTNGYMDDVDWSESSEDDLKGSYSPAIALMLTSGGPRYQSPGQADGSGETSPYMAPLHSTPDGGLGPQDLQGVARLQDTVRDSRRQIDKLRERNAALETSRKQSERDMTEMQGRLHAITKEKCDIEHARLQTEVEVRSVRYKYEQEMEGRRVAEALLHQLKEQIKRSDDKLAKEMESRQASEIEIRHLQKDKKDLQQAVNQQEVDLSDLQKALAEEQELRARMTELYNDQKKQASVLMAEARNSTQQQAVVMAELEAVDMTRKTHEAHSGSLRDQLMTAQTELAETKARLEAIRAATNKELDMLKEKLQKKAEKLTKAEDTIGQLRTEHESHVSSGRNEHAQLSNKLENESIAKGRLESEVSSFMIRLENANNELDKTSQGRVEAERQSHALRDELYQTKLQLEKEVASLRESNQFLTTRLDVAEGKVSNLEQEVQMSTLTITERGGHLNLAQREVEHRKSQLERLEEKLALEKEQNAKLSAKLETNEHKIFTSVSECDSLKRQLETANEKCRKLEEAAVRAEEKFNSTLASMRADFDKSKQTIADKNNNLSETIHRLKDEANKVNERNVRYEEEMKQINQELNATSRKLAHTESALEMQIKAREELEGDRSRLREQLLLLETKLIAADDVKGEVVGRATRLESHLEKSMRATDETALRLATRSADVDSVTRSLEEDLLGEQPAQLEGLVNRLKVEKAQITAAFQEEQAKSELLLKEIKDANEARQSLEALLRNVKTTNIKLEEQLQNESLSRTLNGREADEAKELWEAEMRARTKLGTKIATTEKKLAEAQSHIDEEKRKTRKALEMKKALEAKLEAIEDRSSQHNKEVVALKTQLKSYKRRLKGWESSESRIPSIRIEFDKERAAMESHITSLRRQVEHVSERLRQEMETRTRLELTSKQQQQEVSSAKTNEKEIAYEHDRVQKANRQLEEELDRMRAYYEHNYAEKGQLDAYKKELDAKSRFEINRKLEEVNQHLVEEAAAREKLDRMREQNATKTRTGMEQTIAELKTELIKSRSGLHEYETQKDSAGVEAMRYKDLYENELKAKDRLTSRLARANEKVAESKALLNLERSRRVQSADRDSGLTVSPKYSPDPLGSIISGSPRSPDRMYSQRDDHLMRAVENELNKSIKRHLETGPVTTDLDLRPSPLSLGESDSPYAPLANSSRQYMSVLKKNYFV